MTVTGGVRPGAPRRREDRGLGGAADALLLAGAVLLLVVALASVVAGRLDARPAAALAFSAAGLAGVSVALDQRGRARRRPAADEQRESERQVALELEHSHSHSHSHSHTHGNGNGHAGCAHGAAWRAGARHRHRLRWAFLIGLAVLVAEGVAAVATGSLALLSDAGHVLTDVAGLGMALGAIRLASNGSADPSRTFGLYRLEIVAALANAILLTGVAGYVLVEAAMRLREPTHVAGGPMLVMAVFGLAANVAAMFLLRPGAAESLNLKGAYLEVTADAIGSVGLLLAAAAVAVTGWSWVDPVFGAAIGLWILPRTMRLGREALRVLVQAAPATVDVDAVEGELRAIPGVTDVHQLHIWTLTSGMEVASAHLLLHPAADHHWALGEASRLLRERHGVGHLTVQVETAPLDACLPSGW